MSEKKSFEKIKNRFGVDLKNIFEKNDRRIYMDVDKNIIPTLCRFMFKDLGGRLAIASGIDTRSGYEILYHFMFADEHLMITLKTIINKEQPEIESIGAFLPAADWIEREMFDILGITFKNHPNPKRILMADDWPEGEYPFRRDFRGPEK